MLLKGALVVRVLHLLQPTLDRQSLRQAMIGHQADLEYQLNQRLAPSFQEAFAVDLTFRRSTVFSIATTFLFLLVLVEGVPFSAGWAVGGMIALF